MGHILCSQVLRTVNVLCIAKQRDHHIGILGCGLLCSVLNVIIEARNFSEIQSKYNPQSRAGQVRTSLRIFTLLSRTEAVERATFVRNTVGSATRASINIALVLTKVRINKKMSRVGMRRCTHRVLGFAKPVLESVFIHT